MPSHSLPALHFRSVFGPGAGVRRPAGGAWMVCYNIIYWQRYGRPPQPITSAAGRLPEKAPAGAFYEKGSAAKPRCPGKVLHAPGGVTLPGLPRRAGRSAVAAAAENENQRQQDDPGAVVFKQMTQAVVVHSAIPGFPRGKRPFVKPGGAVPRRWCTTAVFAGTLPPFVTSLCTAGQAGTG